MVQLDGGRFATSDLNDLYRRVINRNNRLKKLLDLGAPEIIIRNEKRMLQEAVDALVDNGRRGRAVAGSTGHKLKSLSDLLRGKQGRFRQNLLGKRVDYSGRSVIVVGPDLKLHQCGLPKRMALELFKPFVMRTLVDSGHAATVKMAKRMVERGASEVWDALEEVTTNHPVLLNRAPTLHRLGIQAFEVVLVEGNAVQLHPLVCQAFNADFDGDQMAVHVPLSRQARQEAYELMLSSRNLLLPADGSPVVSPTKDMVLGCYFLTSIETSANGNGSAGTEDGDSKQHVFNDFDEVMLAHDMGMVGLREPIKIRANPIDVPDSEENPDNSFLYGELYDATPGRVLFNRILPRALRFRQEVMDKGNLKDVVDAALRRAGPEEAIRLVDDIKEIGFHYATLSGSTIAMSDIEMPNEKTDILANAEKRVELIEQQYNRGIITEQEQRDLVIRTWKQAQDDVTNAVRENLSEGGNIFMMSESGAAKGGFEQVRQLAGMRGLMADPHGNVIPLPVRSNLREGMSVLEYFISTHGARKGLADTALRTADSGYLTRRLIDVAQDVIIREDDCGAAIGITTHGPQDRDVADSLGERVSGRFALHPIIDQNTGEIIVDAGQLIDDAESLAIDEAGLDSVQVRSPVTCQARVGVCAKCYGRDLARNAVVAEGAAVGIIAAQSIGEPGTQLTMRTFHTGGVATEDITRGLPRVEELFEARLPKGVATISDIDGEVAVDRADDHLKVTVTSSQTFAERIAVTEEHTLLVADGDEVAYGDVVARRDGGDESGEEEKKGKKGADLVERDIFAHVAGRVSLEDGFVTVNFEETEEREYSVPLSAYLLVKAGDTIRAGDQLTEGSKNPQDVLRILGREAVQRYLVDEVQKVYRSQGVYINDKHIEVIVRQMLRRVRIEHAGDTDFLPGELVDRLKFEEANERVLAEGGEAVTADQMLLGITKSSLQTDSFLAAASFQETTRVLTDAALEGTVDRLVSLKENVIIGKLIPAGTGIRAREEAAALRSRQAAEQAAAALFTEEGEGADGEEETLAEASEKAVATLQEQATRFFEGGDGEEPVMEASAEVPTVEASSEEPTPVEETPAAEAGAEESAEEPST
jgi:DNA-directed RNA polymerase subunit beta'